MKFDSIHDGKFTAHPGAMLRAIRTERGWTLAQVSECTGLPIVTLSKIENDKISLSYEKLVRISNGLDIDIGRLFGATADSAPEVAPTGRRSITRGGDGSAIETQSYSRVYPAADLLNKGDSIYIDSSMAHGYIAASNEPCRILSVCSAVDQPPGPRTDNAAEPARIRKVVRSV